MSRMVEEVLLVEDTNNNIWDQCPEIPDGEHA
jgi:hypothetical protein